MGFIPGPPSLPKFMDAQVLYIKWHVCVCVRARACARSAVTDSVDCSPPGSSVHGIIQARIPELVAFSFARGSS